MHGENIKKISRVCYLIISVQGQMGFNMIKCLYHVKFESLARYGINFWGVERESIVIFRQQKRVIRNMCGVGRDTSCKKLFKECKLLTITSLYILEVLCFIKKYKLEPQKMNKYMIIIQGEVNTYISNRVK